MMDRRGFLGQSALWAAGLRVMRPKLSTLPFRPLSLTRAVRRTRPSDWLPDPTDPAQLRALATQAIDAARQAGAQFADIRLSEVRTMRGPSLDWEVGYGVRTLVDGTWGFAYGQELTSDAVTGVARDAVATAKGYAAVNAAVHAAPIQLASISPATGEWRSPVDISPFDVPVDDHERWEEHLSFTTRSLYRTVCSCNFGWEVSTCVFASTEGALATQYLTRGDLQIQLITNLDREQEATVPSVIPVTAGFEAVLKPEIPSRILETAHELIRLSELPVKPFEEEGRFSVILDGATFGHQLGVSIGGVLDGDRLSGTEADASGTTYLQPAAEVLGATAPVFSPMVTVHADRQLPNYTAQQWDDEGVACSATTLIEQGHVKRYLVGREMAGANPPGALLGCVMAPSADRTPLIGGTHLTLRPAPASASLTSLTRSLTHGFIVRNGSSSLTPSLTTGVLNGDVYEVRDGREIALVPNLQMLFQTRHWWKDQLKALGDASTVVTTQVDTSKGMPWQAVRTIATAPAALFTDVDVSRTDIGLS